MIDIDAIRLLLNRSHLNETFQTSSQVVAAALYQVTAIERFGFLFALEVLTPGEFGLLLLKAKVIVPSHTRIALLQAAMAS
jgi:hypothetical protein